MDDLAERIAEENRRIRRLRRMADLVSFMLMTTPLSLSEAHRLIDGLRRHAEALFPDKGHVFDLVYLTRFRRLLHERGLIDGRPDLRLVKESVTEV